MSDLTRLLDSAAAGDPLAAADLLPLVYDELRRLAVARMADQPAGHTLQPTALVHEAYLRLVGPADERRWDHRGHFFAAAADAMRQILVDSARRRGALKRGGGRSRESLDPGDLPSPERSDEVLAVDEALAGLAVADAQAAELVKLRYFAGLTTDEAARVLGVSTRTAERLWAFARAWLRRAIEGP